jgi:hypothetical protein
VQANTIGRLHRILGVGMEPRAVAELAAEHLESNERRHGLAPRDHAEFLLNNLARRINTPPARDLGAHFLPALIVTGLGIAIYSAGGTFSTAPTGAPSWPVAVVAVGLVWLVVVTSRTQGFPTRGALVPASVLSLGAVLDALVMPVVVPEDHSLRIGLVIMGLTCPVIFLRLRSRGRHSLSWVEVRVAILEDRALRAAWRGVAFGLMLIAFAEVLALSRHELSNALQVGAVISGVGLAWMARSFHAAARLPKAY